MAEPQQESREHLESALLILSNDIQLCAVFLCALLTTPQLKKLSNSSGFNKPGVVKPEHKIANALGQHAKLRRSTAEQLLAKIYNIDANSDAKLHHLCQMMIGDNAEQRQHALSDLADIASELTPAISAKKAPPPRKVVAEKPSAEQRLQHKIGLLKQQLVDCRKQLASNEQHLHAEHVRKNELKEDLAAANAECLKLQRRASELKNNLSSSSSSSEREQQLQKLLDESHQAQHLAEQKVEWLRCEREDLRGVLEDRDRFENLPEEIVASFHERPLLAIETDLSEQIKKTAANFNILVVGGGEPQLKHQPKLQEYAEVVGFSADWRPAEYVSWHKEIAKLRADMKSTYDALIILHWNRTTFTRNARGACNDAGQKPCITCHYQGFTNLRETMQECLRQLLARL
ncbi:MAG: hypothetical protein H8E25_17900 [Planctomycetes bacterium]|nr:hypothetical protein [Planctomycetota bacterium]